MQHVSFNIFTLNGWIFHDLIMKFNVKMLNGEMLHPLLQQTFKMASLSLHERKPRDSLVNCFIDCVCSTPEARPDCSHTSAVILTNANKSLGVIWFHSFVANSFTNVSAPKPSIPHRVKKIKYGSLFTGQFP